MLKRIHLLFLAAICLVAVIANSCKKDISATEVSSKDSQQVSPGEITSWLNSKLAVDQQAQVQLSKSQQSVINKHHVVRIPIGKDAALFFTKASGKMQVYIYKWLNQKPHDKDYNGYITAYSFESHTAKQFVYSNSKVIKQSYLQVKSTNAVSTSTSGLITRQLTTESAGDIFGRFWCWLSGGSYISQGDIDNGNSAGANGEVGKVGCDYSASVMEKTDRMESGGEGGGGSFSFIDENNTFSPSIPSDAGPQPPNGGTYGDGSAWVNIYVPSTGCCVDPTQACPTICEEAHWEFYFISAADRKAADDARLLNLLKQEDAKDDAAMSPCHGTARNGNVKWPGTAEHWLIQYDYMASNPAALREYFIPGASGKLTGAAGYADIADPLTNQMFEIKPDNTAGQTAGTAEVQLYVAQGNLLCPPPNGGVWVAGGNYTSRYLPDPKNPSNLLFARLFSNGVIVYSSVSRNGQPVPVPVALPQNLVDKLKNLFQQIKANPTTMQQQVITFVRQNPSIIPYLKSASAGVIIATILEDIASEGIGILDDWESFLIARTLWRVADGIIIY